MRIKFFVFLAALLSPLGVLLMLRYGVAEPARTPWAGVPKPAPHTDHSRLIPEGLADGPAVTQACLKCHPDTARDVMHTAHWTWAAEKVKLPGSDQVLSVGKINLINNFCIHAGPNIEKCSSCHAGYGWRDNSFDFTSDASQKNVDCLVCHEQTGGYRKGNAGNPEKGVDLLAAAKSVARPTRTNCGGCHFQGGGGDAVKHGDLDGTMVYPKERIDVHMGREGLQCVDCHRTSEHRIAGCGMSVGIEGPAHVSCTDCHAEKPHHDARLDAHTARVACQTCHIPRMAIDAPTKMRWDWSEAGQEGRKEDPHEYLKIKGSFQYAQNIRPEYAWFNGCGERYLTGDKIDPNQVVLINKPLGDITDPKAKIWPFKVHRGKQIYDTENRYLLAPRTWGPGGYWTEFDWDKACRLGAEATGLKYSGQHGWVETAMYWPLSHMVQSKEKALQCTECHGDRTILNWRDLGYDGDPAFHGRRLACKNKSEARMHRGGETGAKEAARGEEQPWELKLPLRPAGKAMKGENFSAQQICDSAANIEGKEALTRPWDVHAARLVQCASCHYSGKSAAGSAGGQCTSAAVQRCTDCHDAAHRHAWLPYREAHFAKLSCEACHIPKNYAPAAEQIDWTLPTADGDPRVAWRGLEGDGNDPTALIRGFRPVLLPRMGADGRARLAPYNLVSQWYWVEGGENPRRVPMADLQAVLQRKEGDQLGAAEGLEQVRKRLIAAGVKEPRIEGEIQPKAIHHGVAPAAWATRQCETCHAGDSRLTEPFALASYSPGGVSPTFAAGDGVAAAGRVRTSAGGGLEYVPSPGDASLYVLGNGRWFWVDALGGLSLAVVAVGVSAHGAARFYFGRKRRKNGRAANETAQAKESLP